MQGSAVLVTGMSGTGKSAVLDELARRGHRVVDTDEPGWIYVGDTADGPEPQWDLDRVRTLLTGRRSGRLFIAGCVANQGALYDLFDHVVLLSRPWTSCWPGSRTEPTRSGRPCRIARRFGRT